MIDKLCESCKHNCKLELVRMTEYLDQFQCDFLWLLVISGTIHHVVLFYRSCHLLKIIQFVQEEGVRAP